MNRITALLLAMAALLVHVLVVHRGPSGGFGPPYESAHVAYRIGRNLAREGVLAWSIHPVTGESSGGLWSYPSPLLVALSAVVERGYFVVTRALQVTGIVCVLLSVFLSTRFDTDRIAGVVPALLLVSSGAVAAAGASGTEWPIAMLLLATSFVALEHGRARFAAVALALLAVTRVEALPVIVVLAVQQMLRRSSGQGQSGAPLVAVFAPAVVTFGIAQAAGASLIEDAHRIVLPGADAAAHGGLQLLDFAVTTVTPFLLVIPFVALVLGELSGVGRRALAVAATWWAAAALGGGGPPAFDLAFVPALPIAFIAIQQGIARALDTYRRSMERLVWVVLIVGIGGSLLSSRFPGDRGTFGLRDLQERVWSASTRVAPGRDALLGRSSLYAEIRLTESLRRIGVFLRDRLPADATVLSPWPGALGYLSRARVVDMFGRTSVLPNSDRVPWSPEPPQIDLISALAIEPDYIVPTTGGLEALVAGELESKLPEGIVALDPRSKGSLRDEIREALGAYEVVVTTGRGPDARLDARPLVLLRRRGIGQALTLTKTQTAEGLLVVRAGFAPTEDDAKSAILPQVFDLLVLAERSDGSRALLDPRGGVRATAEALDQTRSLVGFVIDPRWPAAVSLARIPKNVLEEEPRIVAIEARLLHHGMSASDPAAEAVAPLTLSLR